MTSHPPYREPFASLPAFSDSDSGSSVAVAMPPFDPLAESPRNPGGVADGSAAGAHPMDSSTVLLGLMQLARRAQLSAESDESLEGTISAGVLRSLLTALHFRDEATVQHSRRVAQLAVSLATFLGWEGRHLKTLEVAALLHDVGKIGVPDHILFKPSALSADEAELMALHHAIGFDVLQACRVDRDVLDIVGHVRDQFNAGSGDSNRTGRAVPMGARILAVADAYDSMAIEQVYRPAQSHDEIIKTLLQKSGTQFDGNVVRCLARLTSENGPPVRQDAQASPPPHGMDLVEAASLCHIFSYLYLLENLYDGFYLVDAESKFVVWNGGIERLLGKSAHDMVTRTWSTRLLTYTDQKEQLLSDDQCSVRQVFQTRKPVISNYRIQHEDGHWLNVETQTVPLIDSQGELHGVAEIIHDRSRTTRKAQEYHELRLAATRDALTGVANRGELETRLTAMLNEGMQSDWKEPFSIIFLDVDHFKLINDRHGHAAGDKVLIEVTKTVQQETYCGEILGRYGGEEFILLCPGTGLESAVNRANRVRVALNKLKLSELKGAQVAASFGVAEAGPGDSVESLLRRADKALYTAKKTGRNRTCSLTASEMLELTVSKPAPPQPLQMMFQGQFAACIPLDMVVYKLGGFVLDGGARLLEASRDRAVVRLGRRGLLPFWGRSDASRPVDIEVLFGEEVAPRESQGRVIRSCEIQVTARVRPVGWVKSRDVFRDRALRALKQLCSYFASELHVD